MSKYIEKAEHQTLPLVVLRGVVAFPGMTVNCDIQKDSFKSPAAAQSAATGGELVVLASLLDISEPDTGEPDIKKLCPVGTVARIKQLIRTPDGDTRLIAEGLCRAQLNSLIELGRFTVANIISKTVITDDNGGIEGEAYIREANKTLLGIVHFLPAVADDIMAHVSTIRNPGLYADFVAANILTRYEDKQSILECFEPMVRIDTLILIMRHETELLTTENEINRRVRSRINRNQREYYLREEMKVIQEELGEGGGDPDEFYTKILEARLPADIEEKLLKEYGKLSRLPFGSAESSVITNYLETCLELPWTKSTRDRVDVAAARKVLDADHDGMEKVKERILEFLAVKQIAPELKNQIICLVGPPGVGKTSIAASIARAMKRKYVRVSLGGVRDESDIRGHRKTYIGAMPGRIVTALSQVGVRNPLMLLDEIDKLTRDAHGDPSSALLEVLDPEQNKFFRDHFVELPFDLSDTLFICTANSTDTIPKPLLDRMEVISLPSYTKNEKISIAMNHLVPKQLKKHGLTKRSLKITEGAVGEIIDHYTREAGVRGLERSIAALCRKAAKRLVEEEIKRITVEPSDVSTYLGARKLLPERISPEDEVGVVNGLAYTEAGGDMLRVEVAVLEGTGKLELTGSLGDVMKESAHAALTYVRSIADHYNIPSDFYQKKDIHIHVPEGAVPKDGPSAGVTMTTALVSALADIPVRRDIAMTGEVTLRGHVLAIGGLKEKTMAAYAAGVTTVCIPADNLGDLDEIDPLVREKLTFIPCRLASEVLSAALVTPEVRTTARPQKEDIPEVLLTPQMSVRPSNNL